MNSAITVHLAQVPYLGLRPFDVDEADIFFGREKQTDELLRRLSQTYFLPIVGPSGCGKSSLVRAGLLASLESGFIVEAGGHWRVLTMMPRNRPILELANAILQRLDKPDESKLIALQSVLRSGPRGLIEALKEIQVAPGENLLLLVDQFEEIFRFRDQLAAPALADGPNAQDQRRKDEADAFVALLLATVKEKAAYVVLTMRSDFLRDCSLFAGLPEALNKSIYLTPRLDRDDLQSAIEEPARVLGGSLKPDLVRQLINDARSNQDQLPLMQHVLMRMWSEVLRKRPGAPPQLDLDDYKNVGALSKALSQDADNAFKDELTPEQQRIAEAMFKALCVRGGGERDTRAPARLDHVAKVAEVKWEEVAAVVEVFRGANRYFLSPRSGPLTPDTVLDITHESLIRNWKRLSKWVEDEALSAETYQRLLRDAQDWKGGTGDWLSPVRLSSLSVWKERDKPTSPWAERYGGQFALAMGYFEESRLKREQEVQDAALAQQRLFVKENAIKVLGTALGLALLLSAYAVYQTIRASDETKRANAQTKIAKAQTELANAQTKRANETTTAAEANYGKALDIKARLEWRSQKALSAWPYAVEAPLHNKNLTISHNPPEPAIQYYRQVAHSSSVAAQGISPDGKILAVALTDGSIDLVDSQTATISKHFEASSSIKSAEADPSAGKRSSYKTETAQLTYSPDGTMLYFFRPQSGLEVRHLPDGRLLPLLEVFPAFAAADKITSFAIDASGASAIGLEDGTLIYSPDGSQTRTVKSQARVRAPDTDSPKDDRQSAKLAPTSRDSKAEFSAISHLAFAPDGRSIVGLGGEKGDLRVWQVGDAEVIELKETSNPTGETQKAETKKSKNDPQSGPVSARKAALFTPAVNETLLLAFEDGKIELATLKMPTSPSPSQSSSPRPRSVSVTQEKKIPTNKPPRLSLQDNSTQPKEQLAEGEFSLEITATFAPPDFDEMELPTMPQSVPSEKLPKPGGNVTAAIDPSGGSYYWVTNNGRLNSWWHGTSDLETSSDNETSTLFVEAHKSGPTVLAVSPSGSWLATGGSDNTTRLWKIDTLESRTRAAAQAIPPVFSLASNPSGNLVAVGDDSQAGPRIWTEETIRLLPGLSPGSEVDTLWVSTDGRSLLVDFEDIVHILDVATLEERSRIKGPLLSNFSFNGSILAGRESDDKPIVVLWDCSTGKELARFPAGKEQIIDIMFGSTGRDTVAIASDKNHLGIWDIRDLAQPREVRSMSTGASEIFLINFAEAENRIAASTSSGVLVFDAKTGIQLGAIPISGDPGSIVFNPAGTLLAIGSSDDEVKVWDCEKSRDLVVIRESPGFANAFAFNSDKLVTGGDNGRVRIWDLEGKLVKEFAGRDWRPKTREDAARLSGLMVEGLDERLITPEEEQKLAIDISAPLEEEGLADYWRAFGATARDFKFLEENPEMLPDALKNANHLMEWLSKHEKSSDLAVRHRVERATEYCASLLRELGTTRRTQAFESFRAKRYDLALAQVNEAIKLLDPSIDTSNESDKTMTTTTASLLYLRGNILNAKHSGEARKNFQQIVDAPPTPFVKAIAQLHLGLWDPASLVAAELFFKEAVKKNPSSQAYYYLACAPLVRATAAGISNTSRDKARTEAIELFKKGLERGTYSLRDFANWTSLDTSLEEDGRYKALLAEDERARR